MSRLLLFMTVAAVGQWIFFTGPAVTGSPVRISLLMVVLAVAALPLMLKVEARWNRRDEDRRGSGER